MTWNQGFSLAIGACLRGSDAVEPPRVGVQRPSLEVAVGEGVRTAPVANDERGLPRDGEPIGDREPPDQGVGQSSDQYRPLLNVATICEHDPERGADAE